MITRIFSALALAIVALLPVGTRIVLDSVVAGFHEYETLFFYGTDCVVLLLLALFLGRQESRHYLFSLIRTERPMVLLLAFLVSSALSAFFAPSLALALYTLLRLLMLCGLALVLSRSARRAGFVAIAALVLLGSTLFQAGIGFAQFVQQGSIGFARLGEPTLVAFVGPSSTIRAEGGRFLRSYGTLPHPNVLAGFLVLGLVSAGYLYLLCEERIRNQYKTLWARQRWSKKELFVAAKKYFTNRSFFYRMALVVCFFMLSLGLATTFSRSGWLMAACALTALIVLGARRSLGAALRLSLLCAACFVSVYLLLAPMLSPRAELRAHEPAVTERLTYGQVGLSIIKGNPFGVGLGNQALYGVRSGLYKSLGMTNVWQWEPVHNLYLLVAAEAGWVGLLLFVACMGLLCFLLFRVGAQDADFVLALLFGILVVGLFDHYLWTLQPGRLMLWCVIGLALGQIGKDMARSRVG